MDNWSMEIRTLQEEGVMGIACWVLLRLEEGIEVPERALNEIVGRHLSEAVKEREGRG